MTGTAKDRLKYPIEAFIGTKGSGKTYGALIRAKSFRKQLRLRINPMDDTLAQGAGTITASLSEAMKRLHGRGRGIVCLDRPQHLSERDWAAAAARIAMTCGDTLLLMDEAHRYCDRNFRKSQPWLDDLLTRNYHVRTPFFWTSTAPRQMDPEFRQQTDVMRVFRSREPVFLDYVKHYAGADMAKRLQSAKKYHFVKLGPDISPEICPPLK